MPSGGWGGGGAYLGGLLLLGGVSGGAGASLGHAGAAGRLRCHRRTIAVAPLRHPPLRPDGGVGSFVSGNIAPPFPNCAA